MRFTTTQNIREIPATTWNQLVPNDNPFVQHEFLATLEETNCVGEQSGWLPLHALVYDEETLVAAAPAYIKTHSHGEFVYDWQWADAAQRAGIPYYPKLVVTSPFSPVTGPRILSTSPEATNTLLNGLLNLVNETQLQSLHILFTNEEETRALQTPSLCTRHHFQYHWKNHNYPDYNAFLSDLRSKRRKEIRREQRAVTNQKLRVAPLAGREHTPAHLDDIYRFYRQTTEQYPWGRTYLNRAFFHELHKRMPDAFLTFFAYNEQDERVASAFCLASSTHIYGRYWGTDIDANALHFEACMYQPIAYAIKHQLQTIEPGAGGQHKFSRGFVPTLTRSLHYMKTPQLHDAIAAFCLREQNAIAEHLETLRENSPFARTNLPTN